jgi:hypothetical protein
MDIPFKTAVRFQIRVDGHKKTGYWNGLQVVFYQRGVLYGYPATTLDEAKDKIRGFYEGKSNRA